MGKLVLGKFLLGKLVTGEVSVGEISGWGNCCWESCYWGNRVGEAVLGKWPKPKILYFEIICFQIVDDEYHQHSI